MNKLWDYEDYVAHLIHPNPLVRHWAFKALEGRYSSKYSDEVSNLIDDKDEHLACAALRYLAMHEADQHAPAILESFKTRHGNISSSCASALGTMHYEPAVEVMLEKFSTAESAETFLGVVSYLGKIHREDCRKALLSAVIQLQDTFLLESAAANLLSHYNPEDVPLVLDRYFDLSDLDRHYDTFLKNISYILGGSEYFRNRTEFNQNNILEKPRDALNNLILKNSFIELDESLYENMIKSLSRGQYENFSTTVMFDARTIVLARYPENAPADWLGELFGQDAICLALLEDLSRRSSVWKRIKDFKQLGRNLVSLIISGYFAIKEREVYLKALSPDASTKDLILALKNTGSSLPIPIQKKIKQLAPISELKDALTKNLMTWGDIWTVRLMGRIGAKEFVPDLMNVLCNSDSMDYIYSDALRAMNALDESADEIIITAIENRELGDWESFPILEHLPYSEAYNLAIRRWEDESDDGMDSYEIFSDCLRGIGDPRGIEKLQDIYSNESDATYIGSSLECLSMIHKVDIPELPDIRKKRKEQEEKQKAREKELKELAYNYRKNKEIDGLENTGKVVPFKRSAPKVGRNEPCPCGSGKKYKKCCLNKND